jgi:hypothetical protein
VVDGFGGTIVRWWAARAQARSVGTRARGRRPDGAHLTLPHDPAAGVPVPPQGFRLAGVPEPVTRLATVRPDTVAVLLATGRPPVVRWPGELLVPPLLTRDPARLRALVLTTAPVHVDFTVAGLITLDGYTVEVIRLRLRLQLDGGDRYAGVAALAGRHGAGLDATLLEQVRHEVLAGVQGAVTMNRRANLQRLTLRRVLTGRWLPPTLAAGSLVLHDVTVLEAGQIGHEEEPAPALAAAGGPGPATPATEEAAPMAATT